MARVKLRIRMEGLWRRRSAEAPDVECRRELLAYARKAARRAALRDPYRLATIDEVQDRLERSGHGPSVLGHAAGSVFRTPGWWATPFRLRSHRPQSRRREVVVWEYAGKGSPSSPMARGSLSMLVRDRKCAGEGLRKLRRLEMEETMFHRLVERGDNGSR